MDFIDKMVAAHVWGSLVASHVFVAFLANLDRIIKLALTYFSANQIDSALDGLDAAIKARVDADSQAPKP